MEQILNLTVDANFEGRLHSLRVRELQSICRQLRISCSGTKHFLIRNICAAYGNFETKLRQNQLPYAEAKRLWEIVDNEWRKRNGNLISPPSFGHNYGNRVPAANETVIAPPMYQVPPHFVEAYSTDPFNDYDRTLFSSRLKNVREAKGPMQFQFEVEKEWLKGHRILLFSFELHALKPLHHWPDGCCEVRFNNKFNVNIKRAGKITKDEVADLTALCKEGTNYVSITSTTYAPFVVVVNLMREVSIDTLLEKVQSKSNMDFNAAFSRVQQKLMKSAKSDELQEISSKVSLLCPLTRATIKLPAKATTCNHIQCFDLTSYLLMNQRVSRWNCPICAKPALYKDLYVDAYLLRILQSVNVEEVEIKPDGTWSVPQQPAPAKKKRKAEVSVDIDLDEPRKIQAQKVSPIAGPSMTSIPKVYACRTCGKMQGTKRCSACKYLGATCQQQDWTRHKPECQRIQQQGHPVDSIFSTNNVVTNNAVTNNAVANHVVTNNAVGNHVVTNNAVANNVVTNNVVTNAITTASEFGTNGNYDGVNSDSLAQNLAALSQMTQLNELHGDPGSHTDSSEDLDFGMDGSDSDEWKQGNSAANAIVLSDSD